MYFLVIVAMYCRACYINATELVFSAQFQGHIQVVYWGRFHTYILSILFTGACFYLAKGSYLVLSFNSTYKLWSFLPYF